MAMSPGSVATHGAVCRREWQPPSVALVDFRSTEQREVKTGSFTSLHHQVINIQKCSGRHEVFSELISLKQRPDHRPNRSMHRHPREQTRKAETAAPWKQGAVIGLPCSFMAGRPRTGNEKLGPRGAQHLFALHALQGILLLIAGHTEVLVLLGYEALGSNGLLAALAGEAGLMPAAAFVFHLAGTCGGRQEKAADVIRLAWGPSDVPPEPVTTEFHDTASQSLLLSKARL